MAKKQPKKPPQNHEEGVERVLKLVKYLYEYKAAPDELAPVLIDAAFRMVDQIGDDNCHHTALQSLLDGAYNRMKS